MNTKVIQLLTEAMNATENPTTQAFIKEAIISELPFTVSVPAVLPEEFALIKGKMPIEAIKRVRVRTGFSLKDAKELVDKYR